MLDDLQLFRTVAGPLARPNATYTSILQISKRVRVGDDKIRRAISRLEDRLGCRLVVTEGRKLTLTGSGSRLSELAGQIEALRDGVFADEGPESLVIDADPLLAETLLPLAYPDFFSVYADTVKVEVCRFDPLSTPERLDNGSAHLGLGWLDGDSNNAAHAIDVPAVWVVALPTEHSFNRREVPVGGLAQFGRVYLPGDERSLATTASVLQSIPVGRRVECLSVASVLAAVSSGSGVGLVPSVPWQPTAPLRTVPVSGLNAERPAIFLPRRGGDVTEAADSLRTILKRVAVEPRAHPEVAHLDADGNSPERVEAAAAE